MANKRMIDPSIWTDDNLGQLGLIDRLMFIGLLTMADDSGIAKADPIYIKVNIFPYDKFDVGKIEESRDRLVDTLSSLQLYQDENGKDFIKFTKWNTYQKLSKPQPSDRPQPLFKKKAIPLAARREIAIRHGLEKKGDHKEVTCYWCKNNTGTICWMNASWVHFKDLELDHIIPESKGGTNTADNLVLACRSCNRIRGSSGQSQVVVMSESSNPTNRIEENRTEEKRKEEKRREEKGMGGEGSLSPTGDRKGTSGIELLRATARGIGERNQAL